MEDGASTNGTLDVTFKRSVPISIFFPKQDNRFFRDDITYSLSDLCKRQPMRVKERKKGQHNQNTEHHFPLCVAVGIHTILACHYLLLKEFLLFFDSSLE